MLDSIVRDSRHGVRVLCKSPGFALTAIAILGLGIGANTAIFSVVDAVVLRPLPFPGASQIVRVWHTPLAWTAEERAVRGNHNYVVVARPRADADVQRSARQLPTSFASSSSTA